MLFRLLRIKLKTQGRKHSPYLKHYYSGHLSTSPTTPTPNPGEDEEEQELDPSSSLTLHFLKNSCGLPHATALSASKKLHIKTTKTPHSVLALLKSYSFTQPHIAKLITRRPAIILADPDETLKPKLEFLQSIGFSGPDLVSLVVSYPPLLSFSLQNKLLHNYNLLTKLVHTDANVVSAVKSYARVLVSDLENLLLPSITTLEECGVSENVVLKLATKHVKFLVVQPNKLQEVLGRVKKFGIDPRRLIFAHAFGVLARMPEPNWEKGMDKFKMLGWTEEQVVCAFKSHPFCVTVSPEKLAKNVQLFREKLNWDIDYISRNPVVLSLSFEKRILPRCRILDILKSKGLLTGGVTSRHIMLGEKAFLKRYVIKYFEQVPELADDALKGHMKDLGLLKGKNTNKSEYL